MGFQLHTPGFGEVSANLSSLILHYSDDDPFLEQASACDGTAISACVSAVCVSQENGFPRGNRLTQECPDPEHGVLCKGLWMGIWDGLASPLPVCLEDNVFIPSFLCLCVFMYCEDTYGSFRELGPLFPVSAIGSSFFPFLENIFWRWSGT